MPTTDIKTARASLIPVTISLNSLGSAAGRISDQIDNSAILAKEGVAFVQLTTGGTAPTANTVYRVWLIRRSSDGSNDISDNALGTTDAALTVEPTWGILLGTFEVPNTANFTMERALDLYGLTPFFSIAVWNATNQSAGSSGNAVQVQLENPQIQA